MVRTKRRITAADRKWARQLFQPSEMIALASEMVPDSKVSSKHNDWPGYSLILAIAGMILATPTEANDGK